MCGIHTIYHTLCGCYGKPQIYGAPCIRAIKGAGLSNGCWDRQDLGVDSEESVCRRCLGVASRGSSFSSVATSLTGLTLVGSRRPSEVESLSSTTTVAEEAVKVRSGLLHREVSSPWLTVPAERDTARRLKRVDSTSSFISTSTMISAATTADYARNLRACLPEKIRSIVRNDSGIAISHWKVEAAGELVECENLHWRMYDGRV